MLSHLWTSQSCSSHFCLSVCNTRSSTGIRGEEGRRGELVLWLNTTSSLLMDIITETDLTPILAVSCTEEGIAQWLETANEEVTGSRPPVLSTA